MFKANIAVYSTEIKWRFYAMPVTCATRVLVGRWSCHSASN